VVNRGVILYGPPAVGKDTITAALRQVDPGFAHFERLKCGPGRTTGYRMISPAELAAIPPASILWTNERYRAVYLVDRAGLDQLWADGRTPVVHLGQPEAIAAVAAGTPSARWLVVDLYAALPVLRERIPARGTGDDAQRLAAAADTPRLAHADLVVDTGAVEPGEAARLIAERCALQHQGALGPGR
jgi:guanylate kinase